MNTNQHHFEEEWKPINIENFSDRYFISNYGNVKNLTSILNPHTNGIGYFYTQFSYNGEKKNFYIHRLVALHFLKLVEGKNEVNHIDKNRANNSVLNLEWCSKSENELHKFNNFGVKNFIIQKLSIEGELLESFDSLKEAAIYTGIKFNNISACYIGTIKSAGGFRWKKVLI